jgi:hypothetical protein
MNFVRNEIDILDYNNFLCICMILQTWYLKKKNKKKNKNSKLALSNSLHKLVFYVGDANKEKK